ncbi:MAG: amino acid--tRNA ligase-related protein [Streptococcus salivarius]
MPKNLKHRHLTEFWMMDAEYSFLSHDESLDLQEAYVKALIQGVIDRAPQALEILERDVDLLKKYIAEPFKRVSYDEAIDLFKHENDEDTDYEHLNMEMTLVHHTKLDFKLFWCSNIRC